jgi:hypothetical protein
VDGFEFRADRTGQQANKPTGDGWLSLLDGVD